MTSAFAVELENHNGPFGAPGRQTPTGRYGRPNGGSGVPLLVKTRPFMGGDCRG